MDTNAIIVARRRSHFLSLMRLGQVLLVVVFLGWSVRTFVLDYFRRGASAYFPGGSVGAMSIYDWIELGIGALLINGWMLVLALGLLVAERKLLRWIVPADPDMCPACGHPLADAVSCPECGLRLTADPAPPPPA